MQKIKPSPTIAMSSKAKALKASGVDVIDFTVGEPDFATPDHIINAANEAMRLGKTKYTLVDGTVELKQAILRKFQRENNLPYAISEISVGTGAKQVIFNAIAATVNAGDEVIIPTPSWVSYVDIVAMFGGKPVLVATNLEENFKLSAEKLEKSITKQTKWIILNSPSNPTGAVYSHRELAEIAKVLHKFPHVNLMSDDIYEHIIFDGERYVNILNIDPSLANRVMIVNGVSKSYSMTGFRIGYGAMKNTQIIDAMRTIQSQSTSNPNSIAQYAATIALDDAKSMEFIGNMKAEMQKRRDAVCESFSQVEGLKLMVPKGAFYVFSSIESLIGKKDEKGRVISSGDDFCMNLLENFNVATVSGEAFGTKNHFRLSFSTDIQTISRGLLEITKFVQSLR